MLLPRNGQKVKKSTVGESFARLKVRVVFADPSRPWQFFGPGVLRVPVRGPSVHPNLTTRSSTTYLSSELFLLLFLPHSLWLPLGSVPTWRLTPSYLAGALAASNEPVR